MDQNLQNKTSMQKEDKNIASLFAIFSIYLVIPLVDIPVFGFSLSSLLFVIGILLIIRNYKLGFHEYRWWIFLAIWIAIAVITSAIGNGLLSGGTDINSRGVNITVHYVYWMVVFVFILYIFAERIVSLEKIIGFCANAIFFLAVLRLFEAFVWGNVGAWSNTRFFFQNTYGFLFSMFAPLTIILLYDRKTKRKTYSIIRIFVVLSAVLVNGSRGSWIALGGALIVFLFFLIFIVPSVRSVSFMVIFSGLIALGYFLLINFFPINIVSEFETRYSTFQNLERDKSYMIRGLMVQKGLKLFLESPIIGVGTARFRYEKVELEIPKILQYGSYDYFNRKTAHNSYVAFLAEEGLFGAVPYALILISLCWRGIKASKRMAKLEIYWPLGIFLCFVSMSIHMWGINSITNTANWVIYAWTAAIIMISQKDSLPEMNN